MTLNKTWKECLRMWKWIASQLKDEEELDEQKTEWLLANEYNPTKIDLQCFFCQYDIGQLDTGVCSSCPGKLVDGEFDCTGVPYSFGAHPKAFYRKLVELDKKRLNRKG